MDKIKDHIEQYIDSHSLADLLQVISNICHEKSHHILESYSDKSLSNIWTHAGNKVANIQDTVAC